MTNDCQDLQVGRKVGSPRKSFNSKLPTFVTLHSLRYTQAGLMTEEIHGLGSGLWYVDNYKSLTWKIYLWETSVMYISNERVQWDWRDVKSIQLWSLIPTVCVFRLRERREKWGAAPAPAQTLLAYSFNWPFWQFMVTWDSCKWDFSRVGSHNLCWARTELWRGLTW